MRSIQKQTSSVLLASCLLIAGCSQILLCSPSAEKLAHKSDFTWSVEKTNHFQVYVEEGSYGQQHSDVIKQSNESAYDRAMSLLDLESYDDTISVFVVNSRDNIRRLIGWETNGSAFPNKNVVCFVFSDSIKAHGAHEITHVISINAWGKSETWLQEGLAVYSDDQWYRNGLHVLCCHLLDEGKLAPFTTLTHDFKAIDDMISYPEAGSFVKFLYENYGRDAIRRLWSDGVGSVENVTGKQLDDVERQWHDVLRAHRSDDVHYSI